MPILIQMSNHYQTLGISKNASEQEIKRAYRQLSLQFHPDRNPSEEAKKKIVEINNAYETLSDPDKRKQYDVFGDDSPFPGNPGGERAQTFHFNFNPMGGGGGGPFFHHMGGGGGGPMGMENIFEQFFGGGGGHPFEHMFKKFVTKKPQVIQQKIHLTLDQVYTGVQGLEVSYQRKTSVFDPPNALGEFQFLHEETTETIVKKINLPCGLKEGDILNVEREGHVWKPFPSKAMEPLPEIIQGDLQILIVVQPHAHYIRNDMDLIYKKKITLAEALCGNQFLLPSIGDRGPIPCKIQDSIVFPGMKKTFATLGLKNDKGMVGSLTIEFDVEFPKSLNEKQREWIHMGLTTPL